MRTNVFGDTIIENITDDLGLIEPLYEAGDDIYAVVYKVDDKYSFDIARNDNGEPVVTSDAIFENVAAARDYLRGFVSEVQVNDYEQ